MEVRPNTVESERLFHSNREDILSLNFQLNAHGRAYIRPLHQGSAHPEIARDKAHLQRIKDRAAARVSHHGVLCQPKVVVVLQPVEVGDVFELAIPKGHIRFQRPIAVGLRGRSGREPDQQRGHIFVR